MEWNGFEWDGSRSLGENIHGETRFRSTVAVTVAITIAISITVATVLA
jgi:hypothetical protein